MKAIKLKIARIGNSRGVRVPAATLRRYGFQFHPEVDDTIHGDDMIANFVLGICGCAPSWSMDAFLDEQVQQCGWCMSGQMMRAVALLEENPTPTEEEIVAGMSTNYCRCGAYGRIKRAVARAAAGGGGA